MHSIFLRPSLFARQMQELSSAGYRTAALEEILRPEFNRSRRIVLTFDDGFQQAFENTMQVLNHHKFQAVQYIVADQIGGTNLWDQRAGEKKLQLMTLDQIREWVAAGHAVGSHTLTHPHLSHLTTAEAQKEIADSRKKLEDLLGIPVRHFCYPYGEHNERLAAIVRDAGYLTATTTARGINTKGTSPYLLMRYPARHQSRSLKKLIRCARAWISTNP